MNRRSGFSFCRFFLLVGLGVCLQVMVPGHALGENALVGKIQKTYEAIRDIKGNFIQKSTIKDLKRTDTYRGTFQIKMPSRMRWHYSDTRQQSEVIINNDEIVLFQKSEDQAFKGTFDRESYGQAPIALLSGLGDIEKEFTVTEQQGKLILKPKKSMGAVVSAELVPAEAAFPVRSLTIVDRRSNRIEITFTDVVINSGIADAAFAFSLPQGVSVYEFSPQR